MKQAERIPIQRAREISERHRWPQVITIGLDKWSGQICITSYGSNRELCTEAKETAGEIARKMGYSLIGEEEKDANKN